MENFEKDRQSYVYARNISLNLLPAKKYVQVFTRLMYTRQRKLSRQGLLDVVTGQHKYEEIVKTSFSLIRGFIKAK